MEEKHFITLRVENEDATKTLGNVFAEAFLWPRVLSKRKPRAFVMAALGFFERLEKPFFSGPCGMRTRLRARTLLRGNVKPKLNITKLEKPTFDASIGWHVLGDDFMSRKSFKAPGADFVEHDVKDADIVAIFTSHPETKCVRTYREYLRQGYFDEALAEVRSYRPDNSMLMDRIIPQS